MIRNDSDKRLGIQAMTVAMDFKKVSALNDIELIINPVKNLHLSAWHFLDIFLEENSLFLHYLKEPYHII